MASVRVVLAVFLIAAFSQAASAIEFFDGFESYVPGNDLHGQAGWKGWDNTATAGAPASNLYAYNGSVSVEVVSTADLVHEFDIAGGRWIFSTMQYIPSGTTGQTYFILLNTYSDGGTKDWSVQLNFNLDTATVTVEQGGSGSADIVYDQWVELRFEIDLENNLVHEYYNGTLLSSHVWDDGASGRIGAVDLYGNGASSVYYDDIAIEINGKAHSPWPTTTYHRGLRRYL